MAPVPPVPDAMFHQPVRTRLGLLLYVGEPSFSQLKASLSITDGNLDAHLKKLGAAGYLHSRMVLEGRPHTVYCLSDSGSVAFRAYLDVLKAICATAEAPTVDTD
ncbi:transcriptional regulator [uncultured Litoreibacter sp.]|uniref:transcriptional regulator n=1 Tax=uncultured Litoreibacter sp. TaxID=1392394 RepID=UPI00261D8BC1|nr:transcriptional regulator [uncultured Litoreibacter sp.]